MKQVKLSIRDFAVPSPLTGSIESDSGYGNTSLQGIEIHQQVQAERQRENPNYEAEVKIGREFEKGDFRFTVEGRLDGMFLDPESGTMTIEEIKSSFSISELSNNIEKDLYKHPYALQLLTYGYFYFLDTGNVPDLTFHFVSTRTGDSKDLSIKLDCEEYEKWRDRRLADLEKEAIRATKRSEERKKLAERMQFPFDRPRPGQIELMKTLEEGMKENRPMLVQAPTGLGKTVGVMYPALKESLARGKPTLYITPKNSQHSVAEDAIDRFEEKGTKLRSLTITAKAKCCMKPEPLCNPQYCEFAKNYYDKVAENELSEQLQKKKKLTARTFKSLAEKYEVCPFELQFEAVPHADVVICDYNYVFSARSRLSRVSSLSIDESGKSNLVIDEAHNLPSRAMSHYSPALSISALQKMQEGFSFLPKKWANEGNELLKECIGIIESCRPKLGPPEAKIELPMNQFMELDLKLKGYLSRYLDSDIEIRPKDPVLKLCFYFGEFVRMADELAGTSRPEFSTLFLKDGAIKIACCDASEMLKSAYEDFDQVIGFSATLKPFEYYAKLSGLESKELKTAEFQSPFDREKRKILIIPQISTKYQDRSKNYGRIAETITRIATLKPGNHIAFFPSFDFLEKVATQLAVPHGYDLILQRRYMSNDETTHILETLKAKARPTLLFAVQGGVFSEGVDYPGEMVIGAFVVGPPLPTFDLERETMRDYFEKNYQAGFDYAYTYPAMSKAVQAAGRVIRTEEDKGMIILMDSRFLDQSYFKSMPSDWFQSSPRELVSTSILKDLNDFWSNPCKPSN